MRKGIEDSASTCLNSANTTVLGVTHGTTGAINDERRCQYFYQSVDGGLYNSFSHESVIWSANGVVWTCQHVQGIVVLTLLRHIPQGLIVWPWFCQVCLSSPIVHGSISVAFSVIMN